MNVSSLMPLDENVSHELTPTGPYNVGERSVVSSFGADGSHLHSVFKGAHLHLFQFVRPQAGCIPRRMTLLTRLRHDSVPECGSGGPMFVPCRPLGWSPVHPFILALRGRE